MALNEAKALIKLKKFKEAEKEFEKMLKKSPTWDIFYYYGNCLYELKNYEQSIVNYDKSLQLNKTFQDIIELKIAECYRFQKQWDQAHKYYDVVISRNTPQKKDALYYKSLALFDCKNYKETLDILDQYKLFLQSHEQSKAIVEMGLCYLKLNDNNKAYTILSNCISDEQQKKKMSNEILAKFYIRLAQTAKNLFMYQLAFQYYTESEKYTKNEDTKIMIIRYKYYYANLFVECIQLGEKILSNYIDKTSLEFQLIHIYVGNAYFFGKKDIDKAEEYHSMYDGDKKNYDYLCEKAKYKLAREQWKDAEELLEIFTKDNYIPGLLLLSSLYKNLDNKKKMIEVIEKIRSCSVHLESVITDYNTYINNIGFPLLCVKEPGKDSPIKKKSSNQIEKKVIGRGGFGEVILTQTKEGKEIVIKSLIRQNIDENEKNVLIQSLKNERELFLKLNHPNIVKYYGFTDDTNCMLEYCKGGDLRRLLNLNYPMNIEFRYHLIKQISQGLKYLHDQEIIHGDMKSQNILLDNCYKYDMPQTEYPNIKICDFGLGKRDGMKGLSGYTPRFAAPELIREEQKITNKIDIFAFGMIIYEIITDCLPFHEEFNQNNVLEMISSGHLPPLNQLENDWTQENGAAIVNMMEKCWSYNPDERPTMDWICGILSELNI